MNPFALLRDRSGRLLEIPILAAFVCLSVAIGFGRHSWWKGPVYAALGLFAVFGFLVVALAVIERLDSVPALRRVRESRLADLLGAATSYLVGIVGGGALGAFASMLVVARLADSPQGQLLAMRAFAIGGAVLGAVVVYWSRRQPVRF